MNLLTTILTKVFSFIGFKLMTVLEDIGDVIEAVGGWLLDLITKLIPVFYDATGQTLTFIGWLTVIGFAIGMVMLVLRIVRSYTRVGR